MEERTSLVCVHRLHQPLGQGWRDVRERADMQQMRWWPCCGFSSAPQMDILKPSLDYMSWSLDIDVTHF